MKETEFIQSNQANWAILEQESTKAKLHNPEELNRLFTETADDLSYSGTFYGNRSVRVFLNTLAQRFYYTLYTGQNLSWASIRGFWTQEFSTLLWNTRWTLWVGFLVFWLSALIGFAGSYLYPDLPNEILGSYYVDMTIENIQQADPMAVYKQQQPFGMFGQITINNMVVSLTLFLGGLFFGLGTVSMSIFNGVMLGTFQYLFIKHSPGNHLEHLPFFLIVLLGSTIALLVTGISKSVQFSQGTYNWTGQKNIRWELAILLTPIAAVIFSFFLLYALGGPILRTSITTIWIHGTLEIACIAIATGAGLELAKGLLVPTTYTRLQSIQLSARKAVLIFLSLTPLIVAAGFFEGYFTRHTEHPLFIRTFIIITSLIFILGYYVVYPCWKAYHNELVPLQPERLKDSVRKPIQFDTIKTNKTILDEVIQLISANSSQLFRLILGGSILYLILKGFSDAFFVDATVPLEVVEDYYDGGGDYLDRFFDDIWRGISETVQNSVYFLSHFQWNTFILNFLMNGALIGYLSYTIYKEKTQVEERLSYGNYLKTKAIALKTLIIALVLTLIPLGFNSSHFWEFMAFGALGLFFMTLSAGIYEEANPASAIPLSIKAVFLSIFRFIGLHSIFIGINVLVLALISLIFDLALGSALKYTTEISSVGIGLALLIKLVFYQFMMSLIFYASYLYYTALKEHLTAQQLKKAIEGIEGKQKIRGIEVENLQ